MAATPDEELEEKYLRLQNYLENEEYEEALPILDELPSDDADVAKTRVICLLHIGNFETALAATNDVPEDCDLSFERVYCLYKLNRLEEAEAAIPSEAESGPGALHMRAQILYKLGRASEAADVYQELLDRGDDPKIDREELFTNALAAFAAAGRGAEGLQKMKMKSYSTVNDFGDTYELAYNSACAHLDAGQAQEAVTLLGMAENIRKETEGNDQEGEDDEGAAEAEKNMSDEAAMILAQKGFALLRSGRRPEEAGRAWQQVLNAKPKDGSVAAIATNNLAAIREQDNAVEWYDRLKEAIAPKEVLEKLTPAHRNAIELNFCLLQLRAGKLDECRALLDGLMESQKDASEPVLIDFYLRHGMMQREVEEDSETDRKAKVDAMLEELRAIASGCDQDGSSSNMDPSRSKKTGVELFGVQLLLDEGRIEEAAAALEAVDGVRDFPATAATLAELYENHLDDRKAARDVLERAMAAAGKAVVEHKLSEAQRMRLVLGVASGKMRDGEYESAAESYKQLLGEDGGEGILDPTEALVARAHLVTALSWFDAEAAETYARDLPLSLDAAKEGGESKNEGEGGEEGEGEAAEAGDSTGGDGSILDQLEDLSKLTGDELEARELPRSNRARRAMAAELEAKKRRLYEKKLRKRANRREKYLANLAAQGKAIKDQPDPERWIAKKLRSSNKRGRKNQNRSTFSGAQGGGIGASKEVAKLDAYSRKKEQEAAEAAAAEAAAGSSNGAESPKKRGPWRRMR